MINNSYAVYDDDQVIVEERCLGLIAESRCSLRKHLTPYGLGEVKFFDEGHTRDADVVPYVLHSLCAPIMSNPDTPLPMSFNTPRDRTNLSAGIRFEDALKRERSEVTEREKIEITLKNREG